MSEIFECRYGIGEELEEYFRKTQQEDIFNLLKCMKKYSLETFEHSVAVAGLSGQMGQILGYTAEDTVRLRAAALLHDIGKLTIPLSLLCKKEELTRKEREQIQAHVLAGYNLLLPRISDVNVLLAVRQHHERLNGTGYPDGISTGITDFAKIVMLADVYDGMTRQRAYRSENISVVSAKKIMERDGAGYEMEYLKAFLKSIV